jgi:hypothetical protein
MQVTSLSPRPALSLSSLHFFDFPGDFPLLIPKDFSQASYLSGSYRESHFIISKFPCGDLDDPYIPHSTIKDHGFLLSPHELATFWEGNHRENGRAILAALHLTYTGIQKQSYDTRARLTALTTENPEAESQTLLPAPPPQHEQCSRNTPPSRIRRTTLG